MPIGLQDPDEINRYCLSVFQKTNDCFDKINRLDMNLHFAFSMETRQSIFSHVYGIGSNAAGSDGITLFMLKLSLPVILDHLTHIINSCLKAGYFPNCWKTSIVCPVPKVKNPRAAGDLRPISLLPVHQSGFSSGHSTATALSNLIDNIVTALDRNMSVISVSLDYSKAFDLLDHNLLCAKLHYLGFDTVSCGFFRGYLGDRRQGVRLNGRVSACGDIVSGVPQGSILGPLLFILYTFDIFQSVANSHIQSYADDTQLLLSFDPADYERAMYLLNLDLESVLDYSKQHNLRINPNKTEVLLFCKASSRAFLEGVMKLRLDGTTLGFSKGAKNLGLFIDVNLRFKDHVKMLLQKTYSRMKILYSNRYILNFKMRKKLCESLILSIFNYCNVVYYPCLDGIAKNRLQYIQNVCCRFVHGLRKYDRVSQLINSIKWLRISNTVKLHFTVFLLKVIKTSSPQYLREKLVFREIIHNRALRHRNCLTMPQHRTALFQRGFTWVAVMCYNGLSNDLKSCSQRMLRLRLREQLLQSQSVTNVTH